MEEILKLQKQLICILKNHIVNILNLEVTFDYIGILPTYYIDINNFSRMQDGYGFNSVTGESYVSEKEGAWRDGWFVFAHNWMEDPFYIDLNQENIGFPVYYSLHGQGKWIPIKIADTIAQFEMILRKLKVKDTDAPFELASLHLEIDSSNEFWIEVDETCKELGCV